MLNSTKMKAHAANLLFSDKLKIGTYCYSSGCHDEAHVKALKECGIDFITCCPDSPELLKLLEKYGVGCIASYLPGWWGGLNYNSGFLYQSNTVEQYEACAKTFKNSKAVWGMDLGDEPNALDFAQFRKLSDACERLFPGKMPYINLHPMTLNRLTELGSARYATYVQRFIKTLDLPYVSFDNYMYGWGVGNFYEQIRTVAEQCRKFNRQLWVVVQINSDDPEYHMSVAQLRHQAYLCMSFGAVAINWACWTPGWWEHNVYNAKGEIEGPEYERLQKVNKEIRAMAPLYDNFETKATYFLTKTHPSHLAFNQQDNDEIVCCGCFADIEAESPGFATVGYMTERRGGGEALMITDSSNPSGLRSCAVPDGYDVTFRVTGAGRTVSAMQNGAPLKLKPKKDGTYTVHMTNCDGVIVTVS